MKRLLAALAATLLCASAFAGVRPDGTEVTPIWLRPSWMPSPRPVIQPPVVLSDLELVTAPCYGPTPSYTPVFQPAYNGTYVSLSSQLDYLDYMQQEDGRLVNVNLRLDAGTWTTTEFELSSGGETTRIVPLYAPGSGTANQVGLMQLCSSTFSTSGPTLCTDIHVRAVVNGQVVIPASGVGVQRFEDLNAASGSGILCQ